MSKIDKLIKLIEKTPYVNDEQQREIDYLIEEYGDTFIKTKLTKMGYTDDEISSILFEYSPEEILELTKVELDKAAKRTNEDVAGLGVNAMGTAPTPTASYKGKKFRLKKKGNKETKKIEKLFDLIEDLSTTGIVINFKKNVELFDLLNAMDDVEYAILLDKENKRGMKHISADFNDSDIITTDNKLVISLRDQGPINPENIAEEIEGLLRINNIWDKIDSIVVDRNAIKSRG
jgi:hypothetical protein